MVQIVNKNRSERIFQVGDWVYVKLQPYTQVSVEERINHKLSPLYYGPYQVLDKIGEVAYRLTLPPNSQIHPTFYVLKLKGSLNPGQVAPTFLLIAKKQVKISKCILARKMVKRGNHVATKVMVQWSNSDPTTTTWELLFDLQAKYLNCTLEDKSAAEGEVLIRETT